MSPRNKKQIRQSGSDRQSGSVRQSGSGRERATVSNFMEVFQGAKRSGYKGMFFIPVPLSPARQMPQLPRHEIARKSILGYNNIPELRAVIDGLAIDDGAERSEEHTSELQSRFG